MKGNLQYYSGTKYIFLVYILYFFCLGRHLLIMQTHMYVDERIAATINTLYLLTLLKVRRTIFWQDVCFACDEYKQKFYVEQFYQ